MRAFFALLALGLAPLALAKAIPDKERVAFNSKPTKTSTCACALITESAKLKRSEEDSEQCLTKPVVHRIINGYKYILTQPGVNPELFNATAERMLTDDFQVFSDSILQLANIPIGEDIPAYPSRTALMESQYRPNAAIPIVDTLDVFFSCKKIAWRWTATGLGSNLFPINGMITFDVVLADDEGLAPAQSPPPAVVEVTTTIAESTIGSPSDTTDTTDTYATLTARANDFADTELSAGSTTPQPASATTIPDENENSGPGCGVGNSPCGGRDSDEGAQRRRLKREDLNAGGNPGQWKVKTVYSEFNVGAWIKDVGGECALPASTGQ